jgi:hypothetical protein
MNTWHAATLYMVAGILAKTECVTRGIYSFEKKGRNMIGCHLKIGTFHKLGLAQSLTDTDFRRPVGKYE